MSTSRTTAVDELQSFAQVGLKPDENLLAEGVAFAQMIFQLLQNKCRYDLDRVKIGGSVGKCTAITQIFDFDCVIFINDQRPPFEKVLDDLENILLCCERSDIEGVSCTRHSVQFKCSSTGFEYDLLPAVNFVPKSNNSGEQVVRLQCDRTLGAIRANPRDAYTFSTSLVEYQVEFMKKQSAFVHELVRLCKFWNKTIYIDDYISGRSTIIELIAVHAGNFIEARAAYGSLSGSLILPGFKLFLELVRDMNRMDIKFDGANPTVSMVPPILLEPANPFNNLIRSLDANIIRALGTYAGSTLARLAAYESVEQLFKAQPIAHGSFTFKVQPKLIYVDKGEGIVRKKMVVQNRKLDSDNALIQTFQDMIETYVLTNIISVTQGKGLSPPATQGHQPAPDISNFIQKEALDTLGTLLLRNARDTDQGDAEKAEIYFIVPYEIRGQPFWTRIGFDFYE